jgi:hypothetical protein
MRPFALVLAAALLAACGDKEPEEPAPAGDDMDVGELVMKPEIKARHLGAEAMLRNLIASQAHFQATGLADEDQDGVGEFGSLDELTGNFGVRGGRKLEPPVLSKSHRRLPNGSYERAGYRLRIHLPDTPAESEKYWCAYAWPIERGETGVFTFFVNQEGETTATADGNYSGDVEPDATAAFASADGGITGPAAVNAKGSDGSLWRVVP